jgi:hypothetical protein
MSLWNPSTDPPSNFPRWNHRIPRQCTRPTTYAQRNVIAMTRKNRPDLEQILCLNIAAEMMILYLMHDFLILSRLF